MVLSFSPYHYDKKKEEKEVYFLFSSSLVPNNKKGRKEFCFFFFFSILGDAETRKKNTAKKIKNGGKNGVFSLLLPSLVLKIKKGRCKGRSFICFPLLVMPKQGRRR